MRRGGPARYGAGAGGGRGCLSNARATVKRTFGFKARVQVYGFGAKELGVLGSGGYRLGLGSNRGLGSSTAFSKLPLCLNFVGGFDVSFLHSCSHSSPALVPTARSVAAGFCYISSWEESGWYLPALSSGSSSFTVMV